MHEVPFTTATYEAVYAEPLEQRALLRYQILQGSADRGELRNLVRDELYLDGNASQNLATFCTSYDNENVRYLRDLSINKKMIDKDEYSQNAEIEHRRPGSLVREAAGHDR